MDRTLAHIARLIVAREMVETTSVAAQVDLDLFLLAEIRKQVMSAVGAEFLDSTRQIMRRNRERAWASMHDTQPARAA